MRTGFTGRLPLAEEGKRRSEEEPEIEAERPSAHVGDVHLERLAEGRVGARGHLPQPGQALRHEEPVEMVGLKELGFVLDAGARTDERHLATQDVDQLRELVEARLAQQAPERRHVRVAVELVGSVGVDLGVGASSCS